MRCPHTINYMSTKIDLAHRTYATTIGRATILYYYKQWVLHPLYYKQWVLHPMYYKQWVLHPQYYKQWVLHPQYYKQWVVHPL